MEPQWSLGESKGWSKLTVPKMCRMTNKIACNRYSHWSENPLQLPGGLPSKLTVHKMCRMTNKMACNRYSHWSENPLQLHVGHSQQGSCPQDVQNAKQDGPQRIFALQRESVATSSWASQQGNCPHTIRNDPSQNVCFAKLCNQLGQCWLRKTISEKLTKMVPKWSQNLSKIDPGVALEAQKQ